MGKSSGRDAVLRVALCSLFKGVLGCTRPAASEAFHEDLGARQEHKKYGWMEIRAERGGSAELVGVSIHKCMRSMPVRVFSKCRV